MDIFPWKSIREDFLFHENKKNIVLIEFVALLFNYKR